VATRLKARGQHFTVAPCRAEPTAPRKAENRHSGADIPVCRQRRRDRPGCGNPGQRDATGKRCKGKEPQERRPIGFEDRPVGPAVPNARYGRHPCQWGRHSCLPSSDMVSATTHLRCSRKWLRATPRRTPTMLTPPRREFVGAMRQCGRPEASARGKTDGRPKPTGARNFRFRSARSAKRWVSVAFFR
jgi:hypothetical protein